MTYTAGERFMEDVFNILEKQYKQGTYTIVDGLLKLKIKTLEAWHWEVSWDRGEEGTALFLRGEEVILEDNDMRADLLFTMRWLRERLFPPVDFYESKMGENLLKLHQDFPDLQ